MKGKRITVIGIGRSGVAAAQVLRAEGVDVFVSDAKPEQKVISFANELKRLGIPYETGGHTSRALEADNIVISPGVPPNIGILEQARGRGITIIGEIELAYRLHPANWVAITGSNGKTTTTTLCGEIVKHGLTVPSCVVGNIGTAASGIMRDFPEQGVVVAEISSFQLETTRQFKPWIAAVLNLTPNHLDRYGDPEAYYAAKRRIFDNMDKNGWAVLNADDSRLAQWADQLSDQMNVCRFSLKPITGEGAWLEDGWLCYRIKGQNGRWIRADKTGLKGPHNTSNQLAAAAMAKLAGVNDQAIASVLSVFSGVEHRLEFVRERSGVRYYNDSKATTMESLVVALRSFREPVQLIAGGRDKGSCFAEIRDEIARHCKRVILIGEAAEKMAVAWKGTTVLERADSLASAVTMAANEAQTGEAVVLSPACASYDMFEDFEDRGRQFKMLVGQL